MRFFFCWLRSIVELVNKEGKVNTRLDKIHTKNDQTKERLKQSSQKGDQIKLRKDTILREGQTTVRLDQSDTKNQTSMRKDHKQLQHDESSPQKSQTSPEMDQKHQKKGQTNRKKDKDKTSLKKDKTEQNPGQKKESLKRLTWYQMDHLKYLRRTQPELYTITKLSRSFGISITAVVKILQSKFDPPQEVKDRQDSKAKEQAKLRKEMFKKKLMQESNQTSPEGTKAKSSDGTSIIPSSVKRKLVSGSKELSSSNTEDSSKGKFKKMKSSHK